MGFFSPSIKCRPTSKLAGVTRASHRLDRYGVSTGTEDQPAPQSLLAGVFPDHAAVGRDILAADLEDAALARRQVLRRQEVGQHVVHGDGLGGRREPARAEHDRQPVGQRLHQIERQAARPDHQGRPELDGFHAGIPQDLADLMAAAQVRREFRVGVVAQATQVDDPPHPGLLCGLGKVRRRLPVLLLEVLRAGHQVDEVVGRVDALQRLVQRSGVENVAPDDLRCDSLTRDRSLSGLRARHRSVTGCCSSSGISRPPT